MSESESEWWKRISTVKPDHDYLKWLQAYGDDLWREPQRVPQLEPTAAQAVLSQFMVMACQCQNMLNIELGRYGVLNLPREWTLRHIEEEVDGLLRLNDSWEYLRVLELFDMLDPGQLPRLVERGLASPDEDVREAAQHWSKALK